jgi:RNA polymerase sigma-70 factor (ECF subfamily)
MERLPERYRNRAETAGRAAGDVARALRCLSDADLLRLKALARLWSRKLPGGQDWADMLNEAIARALDGSRQWPPGVALVPFLAGIMRSICHDQMRRTQRERELLIGCDDPDDLGTGAEAQPSSDPERIVGAAQALAQIDRLFAGDIAAQKIIAGLADGLAAHEIRARYGLSECEYDTARKRMRRTLLRAGLQESLR